MDATNELGQPLRLHGTDDPITWNDMQQVFPKDGFADLFNAYKASSAAGDAHVFTRRYEVRVECWRVLGWWCGYCAGRGGCQQLNTQTHPNSPPHPP